MKKSKDRILKDVTSSALKELLKYDVILPSLYEDLFNQKLKENGLEIEDSVDNAIRYATKSISDMQKKVQNSAEQLAMSTNRASVAIKNNDTEELGNIRQRIEQLQNELKKVKTELYKDELTKIYNRKWLYEKYLSDGYFIENGVMVFLDLNKFKVINDTFGHIIGDKVLTLFAGYLNKIKDAKAIRYAGDEFCVLLLSHSCFF